MSTRAWHVVGFILFITALYLFAEFVEELAK